MKKPTPFQQFAASKGIFVKGKQDQEIAALLSRKLSGVLVKYAVASRRGGKSMDVVIEIGGRWAHSAYDIDPSDEALRAEYLIAKENAFRIKKIVEEAA